MAKEYQSFGNQPFCHFQDHAIAHNLKVMKCLPKMFWLIWLRWYLQLYESFNKLFQQVGQDPLNLPACRYVRQPCVQGSISTSWNKLCTFVIHVFNMYHTVLDCQRHRQAFSFFITGQHSGVNNAHIDYMFYMPTVPHWSRDCMGYEY